MSSLNISNNNQNIYPNSSYNFNNYTNNYYYEKFLEWTGKEGDYRLYVKNHTRKEIADEFKKDENFKIMVCRYLKSYATGKEKGSIIDMIQSIDSPERDVFDILVGATLDACGYTESGSELIGFGIIGLITVALVALLMKK